MRLGENQIGYKIVHKNDIVMNIMLAWDRSTAASNTTGSSAQLMLYTDVLKMSIRGFFITYIVSG